MKLQAGIAPKLTILFVLFAAVLLAIVGELAFQSGSDSLHAATIAELSAAAIEKEAAVIDWIGYGQSDLSALANSPTLLDNAMVLATALPGSATAQTAHDHLVREFRVRVGPKQQFFELFLLDAQTGKIIVSTNPDNEGKFKEDRLYYINGKSGPFVQNPYYSLEQQAPAMTASEPIKSPEGKMRAVIAGRLDLDQMNEIINRRSGRHQSDDALLINASHLLISQPRFISDPAVLRRGIYTQAAGRCLAGANGAVAANDYRGIPVIAVYRWLPTREICLIVKIDQTEALAPTRQFGRQIIFVSGLALGIALALAFGLAKTITRPILKLQDAATRLGSGEPNVHVLETSSDELGMLARMFNDMSASLEQKDAQLRDHAEQMEQANQELESFSYSVSHDLHAPLRAIDGFTRILSEEHAVQLDQEGQRYLQTIRTNTEQMGSLIDDLLSFSRLSRQPLNKQTVAQTTLVRQALDDLEAEQKGRHIEFAIGDLPPCEADPALLKQVWINLLSNAIKFTRKREIAKIQVGVMTQDGKNVYYVRDNGVGFDHRYVTKLFGVFQRLHPAEEYEGTGVGLAIVQRIIQRHGGEVHAEGQVDQGAVFYFTLC